MSDELLRVPEVACRLVLDGVVIYELIAIGEREAGKGKDGVVSVRTSALEDYQRRHAAHAQ
ncbi:MAG TPA: hypothetical protein VF244_06140 [Acidimicrobiales bacterium]